MYTELCYTLHMHIMATLGNPLWCSMDMQTDCSAYSSVYIMYINSEKKHKMYTHSYYKPISREPVSLKRAQTPSGPSKTFLPPNSAYA